MYLVWGELMCNIWPLAFKTKFWENLTFGLLASLRISFPLAVFGHQQRIWDLKVIEIGCILEN